MNDTTERRFTTLPGRRHDLPDGIMCDEHPNVPAAARVQGETDSFGSEMLDLCQACLDRMRADENSAEANCGRCDWCKGNATDLRFTRDYEEGSHGPVYRVCGGCRARASEEAARELDEHDYYNGSGWDD